MHIAIFNGLPFHYEMFGYIIEFCKNNNYELSIFTNTRNNLGYLNYYKKLFNDYQFTLNDLELFNTLKYTYDLIILTTDGDPKFGKQDNLINDKTITIVHSNYNRSPAILKAIDIRPFTNDTKLRDYALPVYKIFNRDYKQNKIKTDVINITILGDSIVNYNTMVINRLKYHNKKIILHAISRGMTKNKFIGLNESIELNIYKNIDISEVLDILSISSYLLTNVTNVKDYVNFFMSGAIPLAFSTLTPLIISKKTNEYYKFRNVIEFDQDNTENIVLSDIDIESMEQERSNIIEKNNALLNSYCEKITKN
jgi:hypothetical protein